MRPPDQERAGGYQEGLALMGRRGSWSGEAVGAGEGGVFMGGRIAKVRRKAIKYA